MILLSKTRIFKYKNIFILLEISFIAISLIMELILSAQDKIKYTKRIQEQCEFQTSYQIYWESSSDNNLKHKVTGKELYESIPEFLYGILVISIPFDESDLMKDFQLQYIFGDYSQINYPLISGENININEEENELFVGIYYLPYIIENNGKKFLNIGNSNLEVTGVLEDITGKGMDKRILFLGKEIPDKLFNKFMKYLENNAVNIYYFSNYSEGEKEIQQVLDWINQNKDYKFYASFYDQKFDYEYKSSISMTFLEKSFFPILLCCICNCLLIINIYVKKMKKNIYIRRICGMSYIQIALLIGSDYTILLLPSFVLIEIINKQLNNFILIDFLLIIAFVMFSILMIKREFKKEGRYM